MKWYGALKKNHVLVSAVCVVAPGQCVLPDETTDNSSIVFSRNFTTTHLPHRTKKRNPIWSLLCLWLLELILRRCLWGKPNYREELCCQNLSAKARVGRNQIALETCVKPDLRRVRSGDNPQKSITTSSHLCNSSSSLHNNFSAIDFVVLQLGIYIPVGLAFLGDARWQKMIFYLQ